MIELDDKYVEYSVSTITSTLLDRAKTGEQDAWYCVVYLYGPLVYKWCRIRGLPAEAACDIAQEVFEVVANKLKEFCRTDSAGTFRGWLRGISEHKIADYWRDQFKRPDPVAVADPHKTLEQIHFKETVDDDSQVQDSLDVFERILEYGKARINPTHWQIFWRVIVDEENRQGVAEAFTMKRANVDLIVSRVLAKLKETFGYTLEAQERPISKSSHEIDCANNDRAQ